MSHGHDVYDDANKLTWYLVVSESNAIYCLATDRTDACLAVAAVCGMGDYTAHIESPINGCTYIITEAAQATRRIVV